MWYENWWFLQQIRLPVSPDKGHQCPQPHAGQRSPAHGWAIAMTRGWQPATCSPLMVHWTEGRAGRRPFLCPAVLLLAWRGKWGCWVLEKWSSEGIEKGKKKKNHTANALFDVCFTCPLERSCVLAGTLRAGVCSCSTAVKPGPRSGKRRTYSQALVEFCSWGRALNYQQAQINSGVTDCTAVPL